MRKVSYETNEERDSLIQQAEANSEYLIKDAILLDGKYLIFDSKPLQTTQQPTIGERINDLEAAIAVILGGAA